MEKTQDINQLKKPYQAPAVAMVTFRTEKGFDISNERLAVGIVYINEGYETIESRRWNSSNDWNTDWSY